MPAASLRRSGLSVCVWVCCSHGNQVVTGTAEEAFDFSDADKNGALNKKCEPPRPATLPLVNPLLRRLAGSTIMLWRIFAANRDGHLAGCASALALCFCGATSDVLVIIARIGTK